VTIAEKHTVSEMKLRSERCWEQNDEWWVWHPILSSAHEVIQQSPSTTHFLFDSPKM